MHSLAPFSNLNFSLTIAEFFAYFLQNLANFGPGFCWILFNFDQIFSGSSQNAAIFTFSIFQVVIFNAVSSKVQGTVKVRKFKKVRNLNSTRILICNPVKRSLGVGSSWRPAHSRACGGAPPEWAASQRTAARWPWWGTRAGSYVFSNLFSNFCLIFGKLWEARSQLYRNRFLQVNTR